MAFEGAKSLGQLSSPARGHEECVAARMEAHQALGGARLRGAGGPDPSVGQEDRILLPKTRVSTFEDGE